MTKRAEKVSNETAGLRIVADIAQKSLDQAAEIDAIRKSVAQQGTAGESTLDRLERLPGQKAEAAVVEICCFLSLNRAKSLSVVTSLFSILEHK